MSEQFQDLEAENARLRAEIVELREHYTGVLTKLGWLAGTIGFEPDKSLPIIIDQVQIRLEVVPASRDVVVEAASRWLEGYARSIKQPGVVALPMRSENSWAGFAHDAQQMLEAIRKRDH